MDTFNPSRSTVIGRSPPRLAGRCGCASDERNVYLYINQLNYYVFPSPTLADVVCQYTDLTGRMPLPALWALGYQQCRWGYASEDDVRRIASELRKRRIPADRLWMDIDYMDGYRVFTWDKRGFPRPKQMMDDLRRDGFHAVTIVDPGVKVDDGYFIYDEGRTGDHFVKHSDGREYNGSVWPGPSTINSCSAPI